MGQILQFNPTKIGSKLVDVVNRNPDFFGNILSHGKCNYCHILVHCGEEGLNILRAYERQDKDVLDHFRTLAMQVGVTEEITEI